jgi:hypothetical protein
MKLLLTTVIVLLMAGAAAVGPSQPAQALGGGSR